LDTQTTKTDYDSPWKEIIEQFFPEFMSFFFPVIDGEIDWDRGYEFLDKELQKVVRESKGSGKRVDKLVRVWQKGSGQETWVAIHIEVQGQRDEKFVVRMFEYHTLLYNHYKRPIVSLVILSDDNLNWRPNGYSYELWGCRVQFDFPAVKLLDYGQDWPALEENPNPFAVVVMAHLQTMATSPKAIARRDAKFRLTRLLYERNYTRKKIVDLLRFIDWIMVLTPRLESEYIEAVDEFEEQYKMKYVTSFERAGHRRGLEEGIEQSVVRVLARRFGNVPEGLREKIESASISQLEILLDEAVVVADLETFADFVDEVVN
jgi:hypothetical protein